MKFATRKSLFLVAIQFLALGVLALSGPWLAAAPWLLALEIAGLLLIGWALWSMRASTPHGVPNITPDLPEDVRLVRSGPYRWLRHPIYAGLLLATLALVVNEPALLRWVTWLLLLATLVVKMGYEERLLVARFPEYAAWQKESSRVIPFLY